MSGADQFANALSGGGQNATTFTGAIVSGVERDGTVDVRYLGEEHSGIECLASYTNRQVGDQVMIRDSGSRWTVLGKIGAEISGMPNISWGTGSPVGSDWETSASVKVRPGQIYIQGAAFAADNYSTTPQAPISLSDDRAFQSGTWNHAFSGRPAQGVDTTGLFGSGAWSGGWEYNTNVQVAVAAKTVRSMQLRLERGAEPWGLDEPVIPRIYVHDTTAFGSSEPTAVAGPYNGPALNVGQSIWWQVPQVIIDLFTANSAKGFMIKSSLEEDFMVMAEQSGDVQIWN